MKTIWSADARDALLRRIDRVESISKPRWGGFNAERMLAHLTQSMKMAVGDLKTVPKKLPIRFFPLKQLIVYVFPFPKGAPTAPELLAGAAVPVEGAKSELKELIKRVGALGADHEFNHHPAFGRLSRRAWGALSHKHIDHHLRQFGV